MNEGFVTDSAKDADPRNMTYLEDHAKYEWSDYVMGLFSEDELVLSDKSKHPKTDGLRRVAQLVIGEIVSSKSKILQVPTRDNGNRASVSVSLKFAVHGYANYIKTIVGVADCWADNTIEPYNRHPTATAETRAEGRALRKILGIRAISAEELTVKTDNQIVEEQTKQLFDNSALVDEGRIQAIDLLCHRANIDAWAFINSGKKAYDNVYDVPYDVSTAMIKVLNEYLREEKVIPEHLIEYKANWQEKFVSPQ